MSTVPKSKACFINPFLNHSYLTVRALSANYSVTLFCPPLQLQLLFNVWEIRPLSIAAQTPRSFIVSSLLILSFTFYRLGLLSERLYLSSFELFLPLATKRFNSEWIFFYYQDYVAELLHKFNSSSKRICELIIQTDPQCSNYTSTLRAIELSSLVICPTRKMAFLCDKISKTPVIAPYGGNKYEFIANSFFTTSFLTSCLDYGMPTKDTTAPFRIVARSNTRRKGLDVLLGALPIIESSLNTALHSRSIDILICGRIHELDLYNDFLDAESSLKLANRVTLKFGHYNHSQFHTLLSKADLFIMPSRLESTSLAALEALWHAVPSILSNECGLDIFIPGSYGILLSDLNPSTLARAIVSSYTNPIFLTHCRSQLITDRDLFTWQQYFNAYSRLISP
jgi:glycosyltransferase involved in cell wall biosynthesis